MVQPFVAGIDRHYVGAVAGSVHVVRGHQYPSSERALMPPRICMRPLIIAVALTSKWFVRRRLLSRGVIASAHAHLASSPVASTRWQCRSVPMANFSLSILLDVGPGLEMPNVGSSISTWPHGGLAERYVPLPRENRPDCADSLRASLIHAQNGARC